MYADGIKLIVLLSPLLNYISLRARASGLGLGPWTMARALASIPSTSALMRKSSLPCWTRLTLISPFRQLLAKCPVPKHLSSGPHPSDEEIGGGPHEDLERVNADRQDWTEEPERRGADCPVLLSDLMNMMIYQNMKCRDLEEKRLHYSEGGKNSHG